MMGDFFGWALACLVWAISDNFWLFLLAAVMNCFEQINQTAWYCLLIEDARSKDLVNIYTWVSIGGLVSIFFAPLSWLVCQCLFGSTGCACSVSAFHRVDDHQNAHHLEILQGNKAGENPTCRNQGCFRFPNARRISATDSLPSEGQGRSEGRCRFGPAVYQQYGKHQLFRAVCNPKARAF